MSSSNLSSNLYQASHQWATRPADQRFSSLQEMHDATVYHHQHSVEREALDISSVRVEAIDDDVQMVGRRGVPARLTHFAFGQLCQRVGAPAGYLRTLTPTLASQNINHGLKRLGEGGDAIAPAVNVLLYHSGRYEADSGQGWKVQSFRSEVYERIWNDEVVEALMNLPEGWRVPPARPAFEGQPGSRPATEQDVLLDRDGSGGILSINVGDMIAPAGLYASWHDMFAFLVNENVQLEAAPGGRETLSRGFFVTNSEMGAARIVAFWYEHVCGNHIVWGARNVIELNIRHVGYRPRSFTALVRQNSVKVADVKMAEERTRIDQAHRYLLGQTRDLVIDLMFTNGIFSRRRAEEVYVTAETHASVHGDPRSAWGYAAGATRLSQLLPYADERYQMDRAAARILNLVQAGGAA